MTRALEPRRSPSFGPAWIGLAVMSSVLGAVTCRAKEPPAAPWSTLELSAALRDLLATGRWDETPKGFRIIALSFVADGCVAEARRDVSKQAAASACVARCVELADRTKQQPPSPETDDGLWLSHYALILGAADALGSCPDPRRHESIVAALARRSLADPHRHVASYSKQRNRWPADQTATLASIARHDHAHGTNLLEKPARAWRELVLEKAMDRKLGLPWSEVTGADRTAREPRGCALSWQTRYLHEFDDALARQWWQRYREHFLVDRVGQAGFREWAPGRDHGADNDSGPIIAGVGAAATGLGIAAARAMGDDEVAEKIERTAAIVGVFASGLRGAKGALPDAIRYLGAQLRR